ncbi:hypothetical protein EVAR_64682_1 [Eumeta japonica]|uniref:Uncharacterized protein n=1 Tax=Eumeta variegata TaxID=151549 RepID=A0A4C1ZNQ1_EUMVA|nr:hypothetical protein EVAR_64682_1 [Eumeta japonica]
MRKATSVIDLSSVMNHVAPVSGSSPPARGVVRTAAVINSHESRCLRPNAFGGGLTIEMASNKLVKSHGLLALLSELVSMSASS